MEDKRLRKLIRNYDEADVSLRAYVRDKFPPGCRVKCTWTGHHYTIKEGSLYANQVMTSMGHIGITHIERMEDAPKSGIQTPL